MKGTAKIVTCLECKKYQIMYGLVDSSSLPVQGQVLSVFPTAWLEYTH